MLLTSVPSGSWQTATVIPKRAALPLAASLVALAAVSRRRRPVAHVPTRVGQMIYRIESAEIAPTVTVWLYRANVTQTFVRASEGGIYLVLADGTRLSPARVLPQWYGEHR